MSLCLVTFCLFGGGQLPRVSAQQEVSADEPLVAPPSADEVLEWIGQLGSPHYAQREQASLALLATERSALSHLREAADDQDLEVALRCERIISAIEIRIIQRRRKAFLETGHPAQAAPIGWEAFCKLAGDTQHSREFFLSMHEAEPELMLTAESNLGGLKELLKTRTKKLEETSLQRRQVPSSKHAISSYSLAALFLLSNLQGDVERVVTQRINSLISYSDYLNKLRSTRDSEILQSLLKQYIGTQLDPGNPDAGRYASTLLPIALAHNVPGILEVAVHMLEESAENPKQLNSTAAMYAAITIGRFGNKEHVELLESRMVDDRTCWSYTNNNEHRQTQVGDIALVMCLHLLGRDPKRFNFDILSRASDKVYLPYTVSFVDDEQRQKSRDAWEHFRRTGVAPDLPSEKEDADKQDQPAAKTRKPVKQEQGALPDRFRPRFSMSEFATSHSSALRVSGTVDMRGRSINTGAALDW